jgi:hypothetical protein
VLVGFGEPLSDTVARSCCPLLVAGAWVDVALEGVWPAEMMEKRGDMEYMRPCVELMKRRK